MLQRWKIAVFCLLVAPLGLAKTLDNNQFTTWLEKTMQQEHIPGVSIAIVKDFNLHEAKGFGRVEAGKEDNVSTNTQFQVGELTQPFTASLTMKTALDNRMTLNAPINRFLKSWRMPDNSFSRRRALSAKRILTDGSGTNVAQVESVPPGTKTPSLRQMLDGEAPAANEAVTVVTTPGIDYKPTAGSYLVLQQALEDIYDQPFAELMQDKVFTPFAMEQTSFKAKAQHAKPHSSKGVAIEDGPKIYPATALNAMWSTPTDIASWMIKNLKAYNGNMDQPLHPKMAKKLYNANFKHRDPSVPDTSFGLISNVDRFGNKQDRGQYFMKVGKTQGYQAMLIGNKVTGDGAVIMINKAMAPADRQQAFMSELLAQIVEYEGWKDKTTA